MLEIISQPWHWSISGIMIAFIMFLLLYFGKNFGVSSTLRSLCAIGGAGKTSNFFNFNWKNQMWNLVFVSGSILGGLVSKTLLKNPEPLNISNETIQDLNQLGFEFNGGFVPTEIFSWESLSNPLALFVMIIGGFLVGFGARWAGGCTSGHAISGLSNLQLPSLIAVIGFFIGGLLMTHLIFPIIF